MKLIVWLGNPWAQYTSTKHNAWFLVVDEIADRRDSGGVRKAHTASKSLIRETLHDGTKILFMKPQTFMNLSGQSVAFWIHFYKLNPATDLVIIHDDVDLPSGDVRYKKWGSSGGQNGIKDTILKLATDSFDRVKIGVGRPSHPAQSVADHVLGWLSPAEKDAIPDYADQAITKMENHFLHQTSQGDA